MKTFQQFFEDKMSSINIQQALAGKPQEWIDAVNRLPITLQKEIVDERPNPDQQDIEMIQSWKVGNQPTKINIVQLLQYPENLAAIAHCPANIVQEINQKWNLNVKPGQVYDPNPNRYKEYATKFSGDSAKPSVMVNGEIIFGVGRFIAALLRGDKQLFVWNIKA